MCVFIPQPLHLTHKSTLLTQAAVLFGWALSTLDSWLQSPFQHRWAGQLQLSAPSRALWVVQLQSCPLLSAGLILGGRGQGCIGLLTSAFFFPLLVAKILFIVSSSGVPSLSYATRLGSLVFHGNLWSSWNPLLPQELKKRLFWQS